MVSFRSECIHFQYLDEPYKTEIGEVCFVLYVCMFCSFPMFLFTKVIFLSFNIKNHFKENTIRFWGKNIEIIDLFLPIPHRLMLNTKVLSVKKGLKTNSLMMLHCCYRLAYVHHVTMTFFINIIWRNLGILATTFGIHLHILLSLYCIRSKRIVFCKGLQA
jgi:hypothetical protein